VGAQPFAGPPGIIPAVAVIQLDERFHTRGVHQTPGTGKALVEHGPGHSEISVELGACLLQLQREYSPVRGPPGEEAREQQAHCHNRARGRSYLGGDVPPIHSCVTSPTRCRSAGECRLRTPGPLVRR
jgi:hypothetical protein